MDADHVTIAAPVAILLAGLGFNAWLGWWWADPVSGLLMVPLIAREGWAAVRGRMCCAG